MMKVFNLLLLAVFMAANTVASKWVGAQAHSWMPSQATAEATQVDDLFSFLVAVGSFIFFSIAGLISYSILTCRAPEGDFSDASAARGNAKIEILWTAIPTLLVLWVAAQSYKIYQEINIEGLTPVVHLHLPAISEPAYAAKATVRSEGKPAAEQIEVVAQQWAWLFRYPGNVTSTELHLPVSQTVRLAMQSQDVLHGFYIPEFRIKQDIIPNRTITFTLTPLRTGKYQLRDSQFSGTYFSLMEADVYVESPAAYSQWLAGAAAGKPAPATNPAFSEHQSQPHSAPGSGWPTVAPAPPPVVNHPS
ncbi:cytochrome c oxidase subunit II [Kamptonema formosum]|uniref:cytochrome c oxidase subunit II n=1 Tax=Kamptonema formosum TaxID=331992 RepID=UPI00034C375A|nr:cytochrome c oxidase subunit II [Oscillatoria sp. PCC 10802]